MTGREVRPIPKTYRKRKSPRRVATTTRAAVMFRAGNRCEGAAVLPTLVCRGRLEIHHILRRAQGGPDTIDNLRALCLAHHTFVHANPEWARRVGLLASATRVVGGAIR